MASKPSTLPNWADTGTIVEPSTAKKANGWDFEEKPPHEYFNWWQNLIGLWVTWFDSLLAYTTNQLLVKPPDLTGENDGTNVGIQAVDGVGTGDHDGGNVSFVAGSGTGSGTPGKIVSVSEHNFLSGIEVNGTDLASSHVDNDSSVAGIHVDDALDELKSQLDALGFSKMIFGYGMSAGGSSADFSVLSGTARDSLDALCINLPSTFTKTANAAWAVGSGNGALATGSAISSNTWYHVFAIYKAGSPVDICIDDNASGSNILAETTYTHFRRIGSIYWDTTTVREFVSRGDDFWYYTTPLNETVTLDANVVISTITPTPDDLDADIAGMWLQCTPPTVDPGSGNYVLVWPYTLSSGFIGPASPTSTAWDCKIDSNGSVPMQCRFVPNPDSSAKNGKIAISGSVASGTVQVRCLGYRDLRGAY